MIKKSYYLAGIIYLIFIISIVTSANAYNVTLNYNQYAHVSVTAGSGDEVNWDFSGSNHYVGIHVIAMTAADFDHFVYGGTYYYYTLSDGSYYSDQGTFKPDTSDTWYILFINVDSDKMSTSLTYNVNVYNPMTTFFIILVVVMVIAAIAGTVSQSRRRREQIATPAAQQQQIIIQQQVYAPPPAQPVQQAQPPQPAQPSHRYCLDCGAPIDPNAMYCESCGKQLK